MRYKFTAPESLIHQVEIVAAGKYLHGTIVAPEHADPASLVSLKETLSQHGFHTIADHDDNGHDILRLDASLSQFGKSGGAERLLSVLAAARAVQGPYETEITQQDLAGKTSLAELLKDNVMTLAGFLYFAADCCLIGSGIRRGALEPGGNKSEVIGGILWAIPSLMLIAAGRQDPDTVNGFVTRDIRQQLEHCDVDIPPDLMEALSAKAAGNSLWDKVVEGVYQYAPVINNVLQVWGGMEMSEAGRHQENFGKHVAGRFVSGGMAIGLLMPEHKKPRHSAMEAGQEEMDPQPKKIGKKEGIAGLFENLTPLWFSGTLAKVNNVLNAAAVVDERMQWYKGKTWLQRDHTILNPWTNGKPLASKAYYDAKREEFERIFRSDEAALHQYAGHGDATQQRLLQTQYEQSKAAKEGFEAQYINKQRSVEASLLNLIAMGLYLAANQCYAHSSKENSVDIEKVGGRGALLAIMTNIIAAQPQNEQFATKERISAMLAGNKQIGLDIHTISNVLDQKVAALATNRWLGHPAEIAGSPVIQTEEQPKSPDSHVSHFSSRGMIKERPEPYVSV